jgi:hypothetical protein
MNGRKLEEKELLRMSLMTQKPTIMDHLQEILQAPCRLQNYYK